MQNTAGWYYIQINVLQSHNKWIRKMGKNNIQQTLKWYGYAAGLQLWTHFDVMDNILCQIAGSKRIRLWPPDQVQP